MPPLTVRQLGRKGRFANQLFQYAHLRQRARDEGRDYCCPPWVGQELFGLQDPPPVKGAVDIGYRFPQESQWYDKDLFRGLFDAEPEYLRLTVDKLHTEGRTVIGLHLRRGDYGTFRRKSARWTFVAPTEWYLDWLRANWKRFDRPILLLCSDDLSAVHWDFPYPSFVEMTDPHNAPFAPDFFSLVQCDVLLISNSTFGFAASLLNTRATEFWRPRLGEKRLIPYDPWSSPLVFKDELY